MCRHLLLVQSSLVAGFSTGHCSSSSHAGSDGSYFYRYYHLTLFRLQDIHHRPIPVILRSTGFNQLPGSAPTMYTQHIYIISPQFPQSLFSWYRYKVRFSEVTFPRSRWARMSLCMWLVALLARWGHKVAVLTLAQQVAGSKCSIPF